MQSTGPTRRPFQFSLRAMLVAFVFLAIVATWLGWQAHLVRERRLMREWVLEHGGGMVLGERTEISIVRGFFRDFPVRAIWVPATDEEQKKLTELFPEAEINAVLPTPPPP